MRGGVCVVCGKDPRGPMRYRSPLDGETRCEVCAMGEVLALLADIDPEQRKTLRRRVEDCLRKSPAIFADTSARLAVAGAIRWVDLI